MILHQPNYTELQLILCKETRVMQIKGSHFRSDSDVTAMRR